MSQKFFFGPGNFIFDNPAEFFPTRFRKKSVCCPKILEKCMFWKKFFFPKVFLWTRRIQFQQTRRKNRQEAENFCSVSENDKKIHLLSKNFFFKKCFYRYGECSFDRPAKFILLNYRNWSEKSRQKMQKLFKKFLCKMFLWRIRKQLESPADFFFTTASRKFSARFPKINNL